MERLNVNSCTKFSVIEELNSEFTLCKCYVMASDKNRNMSYFDKNVVNNKLKTLNYVPVVAHLFQDENGNYCIGGHDYAFDENWNYISMCVPFGVVKADTYEWEIINEYGQDVEYLTAQVILWTGRYPDLKQAIYSNDIWFNQSMEVNVLQYRPLEADSNYTEVLDFEFSALCLLNKSDDPAKNIEPCFISAKVTPYNFNANEFTDKMEELKQAMSKCFNLKEEGVELENITENTQEEIKETTECSLEETEIVENTTEEVEQTDEKAEDVEEVAGTTENTEIEETEVVVEENDNSETEEVEEVVENEETTDNGETETKTIDYAVEYQTAQATICDLKAEITTLQAEISELLTYKEIVEKAEREKAEEEVFSKYEFKLGETEEFKTLKTNSANYSIEELDKECLLLVGMFAMKTTSQSEMIKFSVETETEKKTSIYGDVFEKYGNR